MMSETCAQPLSKNTAADHCYSASQEQKARSSTKSNSYSAQQVRVASTAPNFLPNYYMIFHG